MAPAPPLFLVVNYVRVDPENNLSSSQSGNKLPRFISNWFLKQKFVDLKTTGPAFKAEGASS